MFHGRARFTGVDASDNGGARLEHERSVLRSFATGDALDDHARILVEED